MTLNIRKILSAITAGCRKHAFDIIILSSILLFVIYHLKPSLLFLDTTAIGGDTPAHNYIASHLKNTLFSQGKIISWAPGWWCGFPMFQYYFCLPYILIALLNLALPFNIAFKLISVLGIVTLPLACYMAGRIMRAPKPAPLLFAIAAVPMLFVKSHSMWGVNIYSTFAGMISNSHSFTIMIIAIACVYRDVIDNKFRLRTTLVICAVIMSHFFTSIMIAAILCILPFLFGKKKFLPSLFIMLKHATLILLLTSWWIIPLIAKRSFAADFGTNWSVSLHNSLPAYSFLLAPIVVAGAYLSFKRRITPFFIFGWMFIISTFLFYFGFNMTSVFVNIRLWPFIFSSILFMAALGLALIIQHLRGNSLLVAAILISTLSYTANRESRSIGKLAPVRLWADYNYSGLEQKPAYPAFRDLILPLDNTPGRLANDLCADNNALGSTRIFECVPHLINKPILEGGIVNSALGAYSAYYVQGETSENCAGYPTLVTPTSFNLPNATKHLELFNVKHFIAKWNTVKDAMRKSPDWKSIKSSMDWELFELTTHNGNYVFIPKQLPIAVRTDNNKEYALEWLYSPNALDQHFAFIPKDSKWYVFPGEEISEDEFRYLLQATRASSASIDEWLHLGPFYYPKNTKDPINFMPLDASTLDPINGDITEGLPWKLLFAKSPILPAKFYKNTQYLASYNFSNVFVLTDRTALLHYSSDDGIKIYLNGKEIATDKITGLETFKTVPILLRSGRNKLLVKAQQAEGGHYFHVKITDTNKQPFKDLMYSAWPVRPTSEITLKPTNLSEDKKILSEEIESDRIKFKTSAIGLPHIIKCTYYPNWKVRGADKIYVVSPTFMLVYPTENDVELFYGSTKSDIAGRIMTLLGVFLFLGIIVYRKVKGKQGIHSI